MNSSKFFSHPSVILAICILSLLAGGCVDKRVAEQQMSEVMAQKALLQKENDRLLAELEEKNVLLVRLQMELDTKKADISQLKSTSRQVLAKDLPSSTIRTPAAGTKVETVAYLAEIATEIAAAKEVSRPEDREIFEKAEALVKEGTSELDKGRFEQASLLAAQAMELLKTQQLDNPAGRQRQIRPYADFLTPLELKVARKGNVRTAPGIRNKLLSTVEAGASVTAVGHKGSWIKVILPDGRKGWMYSSLLLIPEELQILKDN